MKIAEQKVELVDYMGSDLSVVNAARVSFHKESELVVKCWKCDWQACWPASDICPQCGTDNSGWEKEGFLGEKDQKLIAYLAKHNHWSAFAHTSIQLRVRAPIFVARQLVKHQVGGVWNEVSRRYVSDEPEYYGIKWRWAADNVKQGSGERVDDETQRRADELFWDAVEHSHRAYLALLDLGMAAEQARAVLALDHMTEWYWTGSLMFFARVCKQRLDSHAQGESQDIAALIRNVIPREFEHSWRALVE